MIRYTWSKTTSLFIKITLPIVSTHASLSSMAQLIQAIGTCSMQKQVIINNITDLSKALLVINNMINLSKKLPIINNTSIINLNEKLLIINNTNTITT